jgi:hypothetical protein
MDTYRRRKDSVRSKLRSLAFVRRDREIFEGDRGLEEWSLLLSRALEVEGWPLHGFGAEQVEECLHVRTFRGADDACGLGGPAVESAAPLRLGVERRLQVLEDKRVIEDVDVRRRQSSGTGDWSSGEQDRSSPRKREAKKAPA